MAGRFAAFPPNAFGLHDMQGNVLQWVQDCFAPDYSGLPEDGRAYETGVTLRLTGDLAAMYGTNSCSYRMVRGGDVPLTADLTTWREYELVWRADGVTIAVDGVTLGQVAAAPTGPLGFVAWMDNQWAALRDNGTMAGGYLAVAAPQWLDIARIEITPVA